MTHDPRAHVQRRRLAIGRLRSLTAATAVAGLAGVAGFGVLAAATWSGDSTTHAGTDSSSPGSIRATPNPVTTPQGAGTTPHVRSGAGPGHASTGGSG
jgi:hypothetical protein